MPPIPRLSAPSSGSELTPRQHTILSLIVHEFAQSAEPVGSRTLVETYGLDISPATVRNEMKVLEELGYLTHPHTSAGRVPTHKGYRYFVQHLEQEARLPAALERTIRHQFYQIQQELDQWVQLSASVLAQTVQNAAITTVPRPSDTIFKHIELISLQPHTMLMVLVFQGGTMRQQLIALEDPWTQAELSRLSDRLNQMLTGLDAARIRLLEPNIDPLFNQVLDIVVETMEHEDARGEQIYRAGIGHVLQSPEFTLQSQARRFLAIFEQPSPIEPLLQEARRFPGVQVIIGGEEPYDHLPDVSLVLSRYGRPSQSTGILGVIGPIRMSYGFTISAVRFMADLMSSLMAGLYGEGDVGEDKS